MDLISTTSQEPAEALGLHATFARVLSGRNVGQRLGLAEGDESEGAARLEQAIVSTARAHLFHDVATHRPSIEVVRAASESELANLHPSMRWAAAFVQAGAALRAADNELASRLSSALDVLVSECDFLDAPVATLNVRAELAVRLESFDLAYDSAEEALSISASGRSSRRVWALAHIILSYVYSSHSTLPQRLAHRIMAAELIDGLSVVDEIRFVSVLSSAYASAGNMKAASREHDRLEGLSPRSADGTYPLRGYIHCAASDLARAVEDFDLAADCSGSAASAFDPVESAGIHFQAISRQGSMLVASGRPQDAIDLLDANLAPENSAEFAMCCLALDKAYRLMGDWEQVARVQKDLRDCRSRNEHDLHDFHQPLEQAARVEELRHRNAELDQQNRDFEALSSARKMFFSVMAHELGTPLTSLDLTLGALSSPSSGQTDIEQLTRTGTHLVDRLRGFSDQVATVGELSSGGIELELSNVLVDTILEGVSNEYILTAETKGIALVCVPSGLSVRGHPVRLEQVVSNLVSNALKFSDSGTTIEVTANRTEEGVVLAVQDEGLGLIPSDHDRMFQRHSPLSARPTAKEHSTGMGLYIAKQLTLAMGGDLTARSDGVGKGSRFEVHLAGPT